MKKISIKITKAKVEDGERIRNLETKIWKEEVTNKYDMPTFIRFGYVFIAKEKLKIVGGIIAYKTNKNDVYISDLFVDEKYRRLGIAKKLKEKLIRETKGMDIITFLDPSNKAVIGLNKKMGVKKFTKIKNAYGIKSKSLETGTRLLVRTKNK